MRKHTVILQILLFAFSLSAQTPDKPQSLPTKPGLNTSQSVPLDGWRLPETDSGWDGKPGTDEGEYAMNCPVILVPNGFSTITDIWICGSNARMTFDTDVLSMIPPQLFKEIGLQKLSKKQLAALSDWFKDHENVHARELVTFGYDAHYVPNPHSVEEISKKKRIFDCGTVAGFKLIYDSMSYTLQLDERNLDNKDLRSPELEHKHAVLNDILAQVNSIDEELSCEVLATHDYEISR